MNEKKSKKYLIIMFLSMFAFFLFFTYIEKHSWDNMEEACESVRDTFEDNCYLSSVGISPEENKGVGHCVCIEDSFSEIEGRKVDIDLKNNIWYKLRIILN